MLRTGQIVAIVAIFFASSGNSLASSCETDPYFDCICGHLDEVWLRATIGSINGDRTELSVDAALIATDAGYPEVVSDRKRDGDTTGASYLLIMQRSAAETAATHGGIQPMVRLPLVQDQVVCRDPAGTFPIPLATAISMGKRAPNACIRDLELLGYDSQQCSGCGCAATSHSFGSIGPAVAWLLALSLRTLRLRFNRD